MKAGDDSNHIAAPIGTPQHLVRRILGSRALIEGERKQITVLFADIKGSTSLIEDLDPEDADLRLRPVLDAMINAVHRYEGTINRVHGDGFMALFGAPLAHEDSAVRAAYAAIDMQKDVRAAFDSEIAIRVGLHTGEVLVRAIRNDLSVDYEAIGHTVHLAARMEQMAPPGAIYCTAEVARVAQGFVEVTPLGPVSVKGTRQQLDLFQIVGQGLARTRWEVTTARGLTPFTGRSDELAMLQQAADLVDAGHGRLVTIKGQPGTGKSRLVHELVQLPQLSDWKVLKTAAVAYQRGTPYLAVFGLLRSWCDIQEQTSSAEAEGRLQQALATLPAGASISVPALQSLLGLPTEDAEWPALDPATKGRRLISTVKELFLRCAENRPHLLWLDDLQWTDIETREVIEALLGSIGSSRLLVMLTCRQDYDHAWRNKDHVTEVQLHPLEPEATRELVLSLLGEHDQELHDLIIQRTEGTPLFIEETIRTLAENGALRMLHGSYELTRTIRDIHIPETVHSVIAARIDNLNPQRKTLLQIASVIGPEVPRVLLREVVDVSDAELQGLLESLTAAQFLYEHPYETSLEFKHGLIHEIAYGSLVSAKRQAIHARVLRAMERQKGNSQDYIERLARHALNASLWDEAARYLCEAGDKAIELSAYREAGAFLDTALQALTHLPQDRDRVRQGIDIRLKLRQVFGATAEYDKLENCLAEAETLAISIDDRPRLASINVARSFVHNWRGELDASIQCSSRARNIAREIGDEAVEISASFYLGQALMWRGDFREAVTVLEDNLGWVDGPLRHQRIGTTGTGSVLCLGTLGASHARLGDFPRAADIAQKACRIADEVKRPADIALAYWWAGFICTHKGNLPLALQHLEHGFEVCRSGQINFLIPVVSTSLGYTYALAGRISEGKSLLAQATAFSKAAKFSYGEAWSSVYLCFVRLLENDREGMIEQAQGILKLARKHKYQAIEVDALRLLGDLHRIALPLQFEEAEQHYVEAGKLCHELGLQPEAIRCQIGLGQLFMQSGREEEATQLFETASQLCHGIDLRLPDIRLDGVPSLNSICSGSAGSWALQ